jgi:hypothetical protein
MAFSKDEQPFCVLEYARTSSVVIVLAANYGNYLREPFLERNLESFYLYQLKNYHDLLRNVFVANF